MTSPVLIHYYTTDWGCYRIPDEFLPELEKYPLTRRMGPWCVAVTDEHQTEIAPPPKNQKFWNWLKDQDDEAIRKYEAGE